MPQAIKKARLHKYGGLVAVSLDTQPLNYISPEHARKIAAELILAADQIEHDYHYPTTTITNDQ